MICFFIEVKMIENDYRVFFMMFVSMFICIVGKLAWVFFMLCVSFRFERLEVLAVFAATVLVQLGALFILKER